MGPKGNKCGIVNRIKLVEKKGAITTCYEKGNKLLSSTNGEEYFYPNVRLTIFPGRFTSWTC